MSDSIVAYDSPEDIPTEVLERTIRLLEGKPDREVTDAIVAAARSELARRTGSLVPVPEVVQV